MAPQRGTKTSSLTMGLRYYLKMLKRLSGERGMQIYNNRIDALTPHLTNPPVQKVPFPCKQMAFTVTLKTILVSSDVTVVKR